MKWIADGAIQAGIDERCPKCGCHPACVCHVEEEGGCTECPDECDQYQN